jgi:conjugal transfer pilin signal peptidase TrbI
MNIKTKPIHRKQTFKEWSMGLLKNPILIGFIIFYAVVLFLGSRYTLYFNQTDSLPNKLFLVKKNTLPKEREEYIAFLPATNRYYKDKVFVKRVGGLPQDTITKHLNRNLSINNKLLLKAKEISLRGDELEIIKFEGIIPAKNYFVYTAHKDSYDSRYEEIGLINETEIIGTATPIF